jgi:hypothetical protein
MSCRRHGPARGQGGPKHAGTCRRAARVGESGYARGGLEVGVVDLGSGERVGPGHERLVSVMEWVAGDAR